MWSVRLRIYLLLSNHCLIGFLILNILCKELCACVWDSTKSKYLKYQSLSYNFGHY